jgi:hypothetical protein
MTKGGNLVTHGLTLPFNPSHDLNHTRFRSEKCAPFATRAQSKRKLFALAELILLLTSIRQYSTSHSTSQF